jgi:hypothetical protein
MNTFIVLGYVPVHGWQHKIDFVTKAILDKKNTYILVRLPPVPRQRMPLGVFGVKKSGSPWGGSLLWMCVAGFISSVCPIRKRRHFRDE